MTYEQAEDARRFLAERLDGAPSVGVVLGSGLQDFAAELKNARVVPYSEIPDWPKPTVAGHSGRLVAGLLGSRDVAVLAGRCHLYEGYSAREVAFPIRVLGLLGIRVLVLTNAAGAVNPAFRAGQLVLIADHLNLQGVNPLAGDHDERFGPRFPDLSEVYPARLRRLARESDPGMAEGVYAALPGPNYETPAEVRYLRAVGADMVGMSTVPEAIAAAQMGIPVLGISCIANAAAGVLPQKISHQEVLETGKRAAVKLGALLKEVIPKL